MKIRNGFVSNSSSASFVVSFETSLSKNKIEEYIRKSDKWLDERWEKTEKKILKPICMKTGVFDYNDELYESKSETFIENKEDNVFEIKPETTMFNDWGDVPSWKFIRAIYENKIPGINLVDITQIEKEYENCSMEVDFDPYCWEYDSYIIKEEYKLYSDLGNKSSKMVKEAEKKQKFIDYEYYEYLSKINIPLTEEEELFLVKNHLTKNL